jgi:hypothetical protein
MNKQETIARLRAVEDEALRLQLQVRRLVLDLREDLDNDDDSR